MTNNTMYIGTHHLQHRRSPFGGGRTSECPGIHPIVPAGIGHFSGRTRGTTERRTTPTHCHCARLAAQSVPLALGRGHLCPGLGKRKLGARRPPKTDGRTYLRGGCSPPEHGAQCGRHCRVPQRTGGGVGDPRGVAGAAQRTVPKTPGQTAPQLMERPLRERRTASGICCTFVS